jgi:hypothetical protein
VPAWVRMVATALVGTAALTACGGTGPPPASGSTPAVAAPATASASTAPSSSASASSSAPPRDQRSAADVQVDLTVQEPGLALIALTNTGDQDLQIQGAPSVTLLDAADEPVPVPIEEVLVPGPGPAITLAPGRTVFAGLKWVVGDKADPDAQVATTIEVAPSSAAAPVVAQVIGADGQPAQYYELVAPSAQVGTWQPATQGVLVF